MLTWKPTCKFIPNLLSTTILLSLSFTPTTTAASSIRHADTSSTSFDAPCSDAGHRRRASRRVGAVPTRPATPHNAREHPAFRGPVQRCDSSIFRSSRCASYTLNLQQKPSETPQNKAQQTTSYITSAQPPTSRSRATNPLWPISTRFST